MLRGLAVAGLTLGAVRIFAQPASQAPDSRPEFEVASMKPNKSAGMMTGIHDGWGGRYTATNTPLEVLITLAYGLKNFQLVGAPPWLKSERYDVEARAEGTPNMREMMPQLQKLLEDRLQLKYHRETRELPIYALLLSKPEKLKHSKGECTQPPPPKAGEMPASTCGLVLTGQDRLVGRSVPLDRFIDLLSRYTGRTVIDKTGLTGKFDIDLKWSMDESQLRALPDGPQADPTGPSLMTALQEQLGLKLESHKGPVEMFVIDHVERPSEN
jgi:uncharacterized protein (TIGR03435 family)